MKKIYLFIILLKGSFLFSQITIGEVKGENIPKSKDLVYTDGDNFISPDAFNDLDYDHYKIYLGLKFYNPPTSASGEFIKSDFKIKLSGISDNSDLISSDYNVFTDNVSEIDLEEFVGQKLYLNKSLNEYSESNEVGRNGTPTTPVKKMYTVVYCPKVILNHGKIEIISNPNEFNDRYFTLIDVLTGNKFVELVNQSIVKLKKYYDYNYNDFGKDKKYKGKDIYLGVLFKFQDDITKKEFYVSEKYVKNFILVPFLSIKKNYMTQN